MMGVVEFLAWWVLLPAVALAGNLAGFVVGCIAHEAGHAVAAWGLGCRVKEFNVMRVKVDPLPSGWRLRLVAAAGPLASFLFGTVVALAAGLLWSAPAGGVLGWLATAVLMALPLAALVAVVGCWNLKPHLSIRDHTMTDGVYTFYPAQARRLAMRWARLGKPLGVQPLWEATGALWRLQFRFTVRKAA